MGGYTAILRVQEAKQLLETVIELVETSALKPSKENDVGKNSQVKTKKNK